MSPKHISQNGFIYFLYILRTLYLKQLNYFFFLSLHQSIPKL